MTADLETIHLPRPSSKYFGSYPLHFERKIPKWLGTNNFIHLFSGSAKTGIRIDIKFENKPDIVADVHHLPFRDNSFDGGIADPPYDLRDGIKKEDLYQTGPLKEKLWSSELKRVVKPNCRIAVLHYYPIIFPNCKAVRYVAVIRRVRSFLSCLSIMSNIKHKQIPITNTMDCESK